MAKAKGRRPKVIVKVPHEYRVSMRNGEDEPLSEKVFVHPKLIEEFTDRYDDYVKGDYDFEDARRSKATLRRSGGYYSHGAQTLGSAFDKIEDMERRCEQYLLDAQDELIRTMEHIEIHLKKKCAVVALDTLRSRPLTDAVMAALEGCWGFRAIDQLWPADERRELITNAGIALSVLRTIAKLESRYPEFGDLIDAVTGRFSGTARPAAKSHE